MRIKSLCLAALIWLSTLTSVQAELVVASGFDADAEGWDAVGGVQYIPNGGANLIFPPAADLNLHGTGFIRAFAESKVTTFVLPVDYYAGGEVVPLVDGLFGFSIRPDVAALITVRFNLATRSGAEYAISHAIPVALTANRWAATGMMLEAADVGLTNAAWGAALQQASAITVSFEGAGRIDIDSVGLQMMAVPEPNYATALVTIVIVTTIIINAMRYFESTRTK